MVNKLAERADVTAGLKVYKALESIWLELDLENSDRASPQSCSHLEIYTVYSDAYRFVKPNMLVQRNKEITDCLIHLVHSLLSCGGSLRKVADTTLTQAVERL